jgi:hypothetical protein
MSMRMQMSLWSADFISFEYISRSVISESYGTFYFLLFEETPIVFQNGYTSFHSHAQCTSFQFPYTFTTLISSISDGIHSNRCEVMSHCAFDLHFSDDYWCWEPFDIPAGYFYVFFWEMTTQVHLLIKLFVFLLMNCLNYLYILKVNALSDIWFANVFCIFCHRLSLHSVDWFLHGAEAFQFDSIPPTYFCFSACAFRVITTTKKSLPKTKSRKFFHSGFTVSDLTFKSLIHFELIF